MPKLQLYGLIALVTAAGVAAAAAEPPRLIHPLADNARVAAIAFPPGGSELVAWIDKPWDGRASAMWLAKAGDASAREVLAIPRDAPAGLPAVRHYSLRADLLSSGDGVLVAAAVQTAAAPGSLYTQRLGAPFRRLVPVRPFAKADVRLLPRGDDPRLVWAAGSSIRSLSPAGEEIVLVERIDVESLAFPDRSFDVAVLRDGGFVVIWSETGAGRAIELKARFFTADAAPAADLAIAHTPDAAARYPAAIVDGDRLVVAWQQSGEIGLAAIDLRTRRIAAQRVVPAAGTLRSVRVAANAGRIMLASIEGREVVARTLSFDDADDPQPVVLGDKNDNDDFLAIARQGDEVIVYWHGQGGLVARAVFTQ
jgi:hypothetical protein